jgi:formylglycine-generating enzyme required for sulfatase activity
VRPARLLPALLAALAGCGEPAGDGPAGTTSAQAVEAERLGVPATFENALGMRFSLVPSGWFEMGRGPAGDDVAHPAEMLVAFYAQADEVTWAQWRAVRGDAARVPPGARDEDPATGVSFEDAVAFADALTARDPSWRYRLPTEAEWERAARAGDEPVPAAAPGRNAWGLSATASGPWEWCSDRFGPYPLHAVSNPTGPREGTDRVLRGGPVPAGAPAAASVRRHALPAAPPPDAGVRLVATLSYGKADVGAGLVTFVAVEGASGEGAPPAPEGAYEVRVIAVFDRLYSRQQGITPLPWVTVRGRAPLAVRLPPGRYYAQAQVPGGGPGSRGVEEKITVVAGTLRVELPVPRPGATLDDPQ